MNKCSVVLALYNGKKYIKGQLDSIINQSVLPNEIVIVDDHSTDDSYDYVKKYITNYKKKQSNNIIFRLYKNTKNLGYIKTFAKALKFSKYDIVFLSDQDDVWFNNKIEEHLKIYKDSKIKAISSQMLITDENLKIIKNKSEDNKLELIDIKKACFGAKMFYGCQLSIKKTNDFNSLIKALCDKNVDVHDRLICYYYAGIKGLYFYHRNLLYHRIHSNNAIGYDNRHKESSNYERRILQAIRDYNIIDFYYQQILNKYLSFTDNKNKKYLLELINFRKSRLDVMKRKKTFDLLKFAISNYKYYSRKRVFYGDIIYSIIK